MSENKQTIELDGKRFNSFEQVLLYIAKITGRFDRDLNKQKLHLSNGATWNGTEKISEQKDYSLFVPDPGATTVYFKDLEANLLSLIERAEVVVGCVAWLTSKAILRALANKIAISLIVQKEDFLRPDSTNIGLSEQRRLYDALPGLYRANSATSEAAVLETDSIASEAVPIEGIRCLGFSRSRDQIEPNMHHKFVVFCSYKASDNGCFGTIEPYGVWTGSFNFTYNGTRSLENALYLADERIAKAYFSEWGQVAALSEPLDWTETYVHPSYLLGSGT